MSMFRKNHCVPVELEDPFYRDQYDQEHVKPPVVSLLLSAELYCRAGSLILRSDAAKPLLGHNAVIQALAQKGLYVTDQERLVTERDLCKTPIQMSSHLAMIDTLMMAYTVEMVSVERVMTCIQKFTPFLPEEDFPYDAEEAVTTWINKVNEHLRELLAQEQRYIGEPCMVQKGRYRREDSKARPVLCLPLVDNLLKDNTDGCALAALLHFYCPDAVPLEDICVKETMSLADSLYNLQLIQEFCRENLNNCCHFTLEDMLYASSTIKSNYLVFMAELFWWCEVVKPSFVQPRTLNTKVSDPSQSNKMAPITKQNLIHRSGSPDQSRSQPKNDNSAVIRRSSSLSYVDGCVGTWPKEKRSSAHGISFEIPFDDSMSSTSGRGLSRSASTEGLGYKVHHAARGMRRNLSFQPVNGNAHSKIREEDDEESNRQISRHHLGNYAGYSNGVSADNSSPSYDPQPNTPSIEEALKIIHDSERPHSSLQPPSGDSTFFLHNPSTHNSASDTNDPEDSLSKARAVDDVDLNSTSTDMDTGIHVRTEDIQDGQDEDSSLKDYSDMDQDYEARSCPLPETSGSLCPSLLGMHSLATSMASSLGSAVRMTSFAEQKFRKLNHGDGRSSGSGGNTPESSDLNVTTPGATGTVRSITPNTHSPSRITSPRDPSHLLASEMVQLKMKLEEKRRAIEAQKKKVEAAFTRHRQRMGRTAFLNCVAVTQDDLKAEEDIAQKKAALMEKRLRREKEMQIKKQQQEAEMEEKKAAAQLKGEEERQKKEEEKARRDFIKNEYMRKKQLKLMEDMDSVIKPRPPSIKQKKPRPKSMHRDITESPKPPARTTTGSRPRGYSVSSLSLASLNLADNESVKSDKRTSRGSRLSPGSLYFFLSSPKGRKGRPESTEGFLSPCPSVSGNGENWELESTSSAASNTEYTGPKLFKEPSAKSNKYIIQNALARCCLAGRVNEGQKNKILDEMEKTEANNFLILFRDTGCQFRSLYTYYPEAEEINKLAGIGPKTITPKMIENLYKYSSDKKQFSKIPAKTMSASVDAITIYSHLWQNKKQNTPKKLLK
ncbi:calmodulin-regulated spectrin-associated protein 2-like [Sinocyclocheilus grahami]|uniref:calmodulin-regulated spectrin-associated protein 2-like n=1 Tax=Sinocyclocheilus grahami TaxID=75366 RepID=UPI0007AC70AD|nr:PREDICTED: calmodulin-regulated spectrin-associated protein 2-like [Sinocyclocheilus grahami]